MGLRRFYTVVHFHEPASLAMIRPLRLLIALVFLAVGAGLGALNPASVTVDLGIVRFEAALGVILLSALFCGVVLGGLALTVSVVIPMRHRLRRDRIAAAQTATNPAKSSGAATQSGAPPSTEHVTEPRGIEHGIHQ
jgi:lipopolysaccharide assembly protein A